MMIKRSAFLACIWVIASLLVSTARASSGPKKELNLPAPKRIENPLFSVTIPKGWSYLIVDSLKARASASNTSQRIILTPTSPPEKSTVGISIFDQVPKAAFDAEKVAKLKKPPLVVQTQNWGGHEWKLIEEMHTYHSTQMMHWLATTSLKDRDLEITANFPASEDAIQGPIFNKILQSIKITESSDPAH